MNSDFHASGQAPADHPPGARPLRWAAWQRPWQAHVQGRWQAVSARERRLLAGAGALLTVALLWFVALQPAVRTLKQAPAEKARLDAQLTEMRALAQEAVQLRTAPALAPEQAIVALQATTEQLGAAAQLSLQGERAVVTLQGLDPVKLGPWLEEVRSGARARPLDAQLSNGAAGLSGTVVLALGAKP